MKYRDTRCNAKGIIKIPTQIAVRAPPGRSNLGCRYIYRIDNDNNWFRVQYTGLSVPQTYNIVSPSERIVSRDFHPKQPLPQLTT